MPAWENRKKRAIDLNRYEDSPDVQNKARLTEVDYHKKMNRWILLFAAISFAFFAVFHFRLGNSGQALIFTLLFINVTVPTIVGLWIEDLEKLVLLKRSTGAIGFGLLAASLLAGTLSKNVYIFLPWLFTYPVAVTLFFGKRIGIYSAVAFTLVTMIAVFIMHLPPWNAGAIKMFKLNAALSLLSIMIISLVAEKSRIRVQNDLVASQEGYKAAEARQREANEELQREIDLRIASEKMLAQSEMHYRALFEESAVSLWEEDWSGLKVYLDELPQEAADDLPGYFKANPDQIAACWKMMRITAVNRATLTLYAADTSATLFNNLPSLMPAPERQSYLSGRITGLYHEGRFQTEIQGRRLDGTPLHLLVNSTIPAGYQTTWKKVFSSVYDVTERMVMEQEKKRVERQLNEARQMQAVATMAGGIAHQFNNALAAIYGNVEMIEMDAPPPRHQRFIDSLRRSADRMSMLTDQLLAYARGGKYQPKTFSVNDLIQALLASDRIAPDPSIAVSLALAPDICMASGDTAQIEMVVEAVLSNALESMNEEGQLTISTQNLHIDDAKTAQPENLAPGDYALIRVIDSGAGMDEQTRERIFEPFFTTKFFGRGLGMAAAYGIVQNHDGMITVDSAPEQGTCVTIYLPGKTDTGHRNQSAA